MKTKILLFLLTIALSISVLHAQSNIKSIDTTVFKFMPLKVGNIWVHDYFWIPPNRGKVRTLISGTIVANGHLYYVLTKYTNPPSTPCNNIIYPSYLRIDSTSGNLYTYTPNQGCSYSPNERLVDSLMARIRDVAFINCTNNDSLRDTTPVNIFGSLRAKRRFGYVYYEWAYAHDYVKGIGISESHNYAIIPGCDYFITGCIIDGILYGDTSMIVGLHPLSSEVPKQFGLYQNYPNPFNPTTKIKFDLPSVGQRQAFDLQLIIYDVLGREIATLVNERLKPGTYEVEWDGTNYTSGVYFYKLTAGDFVETKKMILLK